MSWWLALWLMTATVTADFTHKHRYVAVTNDCTLKVFSPDVSSIPSEPFTDGKCYNTVEFAVIQYEHDSALFVFRRNANSSYKLDVFGTMIDDHERAPIDLEEEFETIDLEYALRRDGYDCRFGEFKEGGFAAAIDFNILHIVVRCTLSDDLNTNPRVYLPQFVNEANNQMEPELFGLLRFAVHTQLQILTVPMSGLVLFKIPEEKGKYFSNVTLIPSYKDNDAQLVAYRTTIDNAQSSYTLQKYKIQELYGNPMNFSGVENSNYKTGDIIRYTTSDKTMIKRPLHTGNNDITVGDKTFNTSLTLIFQVRALTNTFNEKREWKFRTLMDPISTPKGVDLTECDKKLVQQIQDCYETRKRKEGLVYLVGFGGIGGTFGLLLTTIILFSCCIFKQRKRRKLQRQRRKERKLLRQRNKETSDGTATDASKVSNAGTDPKV